MLTRRSVLQFSAGVEGATGLALIVVPVFVGRLLLGQEIAEAGLAVARCFGVALIALSLALWPRGEETAQGTRAMLLYNAGLAIYLSWLGTAGHLSGPALWPAAAIHAVVAGLLARPAGTGIDPS